MLDIKRIREDFDNVKKAIESRGNGDYNIGHAIELDDRRRELLGAVSYTHLKQRQKKRRQLLHQTLPMPLPQTLTPYTKKIFSPRSRCIFTVFPIL